MKLALALLVAALLAPFGAIAQSFPERPVTLIVPWPAGGGTDIALRALAETTSKHLGQRIVVENRPGAGGTIGPSWMAKNAKPGKFTYGTPGTGTTLHITMEEIAAREGVKFLHVPFKGNADATTALLGGHIMASADSTGWGEFVDAGKLRMLVTWGPQRTKRWPTVPTLKELGYPIVSSSPYGIAGPKGMDSRAVRVLHDAFKKGMEDPAFIKTLERLDQNEPFYMPPDEYAKFVRKIYEDEKVNVERLGLKQ